MFDIIIVGAGTAGMSAAIYAARANKKVLILEGMNYGGQIIYTNEVENYPGIKKISGFDFATGLYEQVKVLGVEIVYEKVEAIKDAYSSTKKVVTSNNKYECSAIIIATGTTNRTLGIDKEKEYIGRGVSYCATCDGNFFRNKTVAIVGGGNTALNEALYLSNICEKVYLVHRRDEFRAEKVIQDKVKEKTNIEIIYNSVVKDLEGEDNLQGIILTNTATKEQSSIAVSGVFVAIGQIPDIKIVSGIVNLDKTGYIIADETCKTNVEGIFVAGDCRTKELRQLTTAASDGAIAAVNACEYIG